MIALPLLPASRHITTSPDGTRALGGALVELLHPGGTVALSGPLGSGKTVFVLGMAEALGVPPDMVASPTFTLVRVYPGRLRLYHLDAYRLTCGADFVELGGRDILAAGGITAIEWAERLGEELPGSVIRVDFRHQGNNRREIRIRQSLAE
ncbi:MAG: tRNA (adenosine(37)-N6)-threonylcarbamoyltransferase complex ATPase subunit type 1 TsaE [Planctomycetota bacterium]